MPSMNERKPCINLAEPSRGGAVIWVSDEFFAPAKRMLKPDEPHFDPELFDHNGKWMDGWESRRKRAQGHDSCVLRICPGVIYGVDIDTRHFTGNYAPAASIEACRVVLDPDQAAGWTEILARTELQGNAHHYLRIASREAWTHLRLNIFPDGGIARLRVYGKPEYETEDQQHPGPLVNLACAGEGAAALSCNDMHFGDMSNVLQPHPPSGMADGWETRRRRTPGNDWMIIRLAQPGRICRAEVDTAFFKGNSPARCSLRGALLDHDPADDGSTLQWPEIMPPVALGPDQFHSFEREIANIGPVSHVRFDIYPDGGVARFRLFGIPGAEPS
ncbi:MAG: allantoicase [Xanthomonadales bacterium]|nr:allantoicase [Xanthomonadales bacterium]